VRTAQRVLSNRGRSRTYFPVGFEVVARRRGGDDERVTVVSSRNYLRAARTGLRAGVCIRHIVKLQQEGADYGFLLR